MAKIPCIYNLWRTGNNFKSCNSCNWRR